MAAIIQNRQCAEQIRVAVAFEQGKIRPVCFEISQPAADRNFVRAINQVWESPHGAAQRLHYTVSADIGNFVLTFNSASLAWQLEIVEESNCFLTTFGQPPSSAPKEPTT
jgi:hypothetical protein